MTQKKMVNQVLKYTKKNGKSRQEMKEKRLWEETGDFSSTDPYKMKE
jgi:hypothetical protein